MDLVQIVIIISLLAVSTIIVVTGIYLIRLIKELTQVVSKANTMADSISRPVSSISEFLVGFKNGLQVFNSFFKKNKDE